MLRGKRNVCEVFWRYQELHVLCLPTSRALPNHGQALCQGTSPILSYKHTVVSFVWSNCPKFISSDRRHNPFQTWNLWMLRTNEDSSPELGKEGRSQRSEFLSFQPWPPTPSLPTCLRYMVWGTEHPYPGSNPSSTSSWLRSLRHLT